MIFSLPTVGSFLLGLLKNPIVLLSIALAVMVSLWWIRGNTIERLEADLSQAHNYNTELSETLVRQRIDNAHQLAIISDLEEEKRKISNELSEELGRIRNIDEGDDGELAPVYRDTFEWLRQHQVRDGEDN